MLNEVFIILVLLSHFVYTAWLLKKDLHILQLNSYFNDRCLQWLRAKWTLVFPEYNLLPLFAIPLSLLLPKFSVLLYLFTAYLVVLFKKREQGQEKKPLVFTPRAVRLYVTCILFLAFIDVVIWFWLGFTPRIYLFLSIIVLATFSYFSCLLLFFSNYFLTPLEKVITFYYFNDAKKRLQWLRNLKVIGITGSFGKTSTKHILNEILRHKYNILSLPGSFNTPMGIAKIVRTELKPTHEIFVAELSAKKSGDIRELCELVHPKFGVITAIGEQHLETFKSLENIKQTKNELIEALPEDGTAFFNMDNEHCRVLAKLTRRKSIYYGVDADNLDYKASNIQVNADGSNFIVKKANGETATFQTKLLGKHNVYNILAAVAVASELGMDFKDMLYPIRQLSPVEHRLELRKIGPGATLLDDTFNSNPIGSKIALDVLASMTGARKIIITPGMVELGEKEYELNSKFGEYIADVCDYAILVGKKQSIAILEGLKKKHFSEQAYFIAQDFQDAYRHLLGFLQKDDVVLFENDLPVDS